MAPRLRRLPRFPRIPALGFTAIRNEPNFRGGAAEVTSNQEKQREARIRNEPNFAASGYPNRSSRCSWRATGHGSTGQPNNWSGDEHYLGTYDGGEWVDVWAEGDDFWMPTGFLCEWDE